MNLLTILSILNLGNMENTICINVQPVRLRLSSKSASQPAVLLISSEQAVVVELILP
jgi:hypothetical protein